MKRLLGSILTVLLVLSAIPPTLNAQIENPVTLRLPISGIPDVIDPALVHIEHEVDASVNLFIPLVMSSPTEFGVIEPSLAERWEISEDGLNYTFFLRDDVPWVRYDPATQQIVPLRFITADDVVYSVRRACSDWRNGYYAVDVFGPIIAGCDRALDGADPTQVGIEALDEHTVRFTLTAPGAYFLSIATLWTISPVPHEAIETYGENWTQVGNLVTSGPFVLTEWDSQMIYVRNPYLPNDISGPGNVEKVITVPYSDFESFNAFQNGELDRGTTSSFDFLQNHPDQVVFFPSAMVSYLGISTDKPPMDNVHVRRAFSAAISRQAYIDAIGSGYNEPMYHFLPEVLFGGLPGTEVGVGFNLQYAKEQLAEAGYPDCLDLPTVEAYVWDEVTAEFLQDQIAQLGCTDEQFIASAEEDTNNLIDPTNFAPAESRPHIYFAGWSPDYADADTNMMLISCGVNNDFRRECTEVDDLITVARRTSDPDERIDLYRQLQEDLFGEEGEFPMIPLAREVLPRAVAPYFTGPNETNGVIGGERYDFYSIGDAPPYTALVPEFSETAANLPPAPVPEPSTPVETVPTPQADTPVDTVPIPQAPTFELTTTECTIHVIIPQRVNMRVGPGLDQIWVGFLPRGVEHRVVGQSKDKFNMTWWQLDSGYWVRFDIVGESDACPQ